MVLVRELEIKRPLGRPKCRREDNIKKDVRKIGCGVMCSIHRARGRDQQRAFVNTVMYPPISKFWDIFE
jgi:hypothetical protein